MFMKIKTLEVVISISGPSSTAVVKDKQQNIFEKVSLNVIKIRQLSWPLKNDSLTDPEKRLSYCAK